MFRRILVPLDGSRLAATALPYAVALAHATEARLTLLAVVDPVPETADWQSTAGQEGDERHVTESKAYLESVALPLRTRGLAVTTLIRHGNPANAILTAAQTEDCSLIVMGTHGRTGFDRMRMGSVAQHVLRHATVPALVVPPGAVATGGDATITSVTVPLDGSPLAEAALPIATQIATALSVPLTLFQVIPRISIGWGAGYESSYYPVSEEMEHDEEMAVSAYLEATAARLRESGLTVRTEWERSMTSGAEELIAAHLAKRATGITVMASHGRGGVMRWVLGSTAEAVLDRASCPILIVRAGASTRAEHEDVPVRVTQDAGEREGGMTGATANIAGEVGSAGEATVPTDTELTHAVTDTIGEIPYALSHITISVHGGTVTLRGTVTDDLERYAAENAARRTHGVQAVVNRITNAPCLISERTRNR